MVSTYKEVKFIILSIGILLLWYLIIKFLITEEKFNIEIFLFFVLILVTYVGILLKKEFGRILAIVFYCYGILRMSGSALYILYLYVTGTFLKMGFHVKGSTWIIFAINVLIVLLFSRELKLSLKLYD